MWRRLEDDDRWTREGMPCESNVFLVCPSGGVCCSLLLKMTRRTFGVQKPIALARAMAMPLRNSGEEVTGNSHRPYGERGQAVTSARVGRGVGNDNPDSGHKWHPLAWP